MRGRGYTASNTVRLRFCQRGDTYSQWWTSSNTQIALCRETPLTRGLTPQMRGAFAMGQRRSNEIETDLDLDLQPESLSDPSRTLVSGRSGPVGTMTMTDDSIRL